MLIILLYKLSFCRLVDLDNNIPELHNIIEDQNEKLVLLQQLGTELTNHIVNGHVTNLTNS